MILPLGVLLALAARRRAQAAPAAPASTAQPTDDDWWWPYPTLDADAAQLAGVRPVPLISDGVGPNKRRRDDGTMRAHEGVDLAYRRIEAASAPILDGGSKWFLTPAGTPVLAARAGRVWSAQRTSRGWRVVLDHGKPWATVYTHLATLAIPEVTRANRNTVAVRGGELLGEAGADPRDAQGLRHLHFELHRDGRPIDPAPLMAQWQRA